MSLVSFSLIKKCALLQEKPAKCSHKYLVGIYASLILYISSNPNDKAAPIFALHNDMKSDSNRCINVNNICRTWEKKSVTAWMASSKGACPHSAHLMGVGSCARSQAHSDGWILNGECSCKSRLQKLGNQSTHSTDGSGFIKICNAMYFIQYNQKNQNQQIF